jgi:signal transduction histidine kinase
VEDPCVSLLANTRLNPGYCFGSEQRVSNAVDRLVGAEAKLLTERQTAELREQFIAVLGHDLRNPLASIAAGTRMLAKARSKKPPRRFSG